MLVRDYRLEIKLIDVPEPKEGGEDKEATVTLPIDAIAVSVAIFNGKLAARFLVPASDVYRDLNYKSDV